jgi:hypothetical protein
MTPRRGSGEGGVLGLLGSARGGCAGVPRSGEHGGNRVGDQRRPGQLERGRRRGRGRKSEADSRLTLVARGDGMAVPVADRGRASSSCLAPAAAAGGHGRHRPTGPVPGRQDR